MEIKTKQWSAGGGSATIQYDGQGDGKIIITSDANSLYEVRSMQITVETTNGSPKQTKTITINQAAKQRIDLSAAVVTAATQTYSGTAKTSTPTVTLNGSTVPSSGYDVTYSNNTNAGTATITITGKGDYTGTAYGTFTIAKASRTLSFADSYMVLNTSSTGTKTAAPSAGSGDGAITYSIANTTYATINSSTGAVASKTSDGSVIVTATIAEGQNYLGATATYLLYVFATTHNYSYSGSTKNVNLPPGTYQFQCWGAQGATCADGYSGGKGGYSVGKLSIANALAIQVLVGGQNGYNGGGSSSGSSSYNSGDTYGRSSMGNGGGATDIRLSDGALLSRMIVAGGGSGGAMCYKETTTETIENIGCTNFSQYWRTADTTNYIWGQIEPSIRGRVTKITFLATTGTIYFYKITAADTSEGAIISASLITSVTNTASQDGTIKSVSVDVTIGENEYIGYNGAFRFNNYDQTYTIFYADTSNYAVVSSHDVMTTPMYFEVVTGESTTTSSDYQVGYAGGGTNGAGYSSSYYGKQNGAGSGGSFGQGANQTITNYRFCSGAGGGGWYGGGGQYSDNDMNTVHLSGGGSGFVNTSESAGNRPSGYTGLELDSGTTYAGNTSFPSTGGGTETGHSGNGYVRITRVS